MYFSALDKIAIVGTSPVAQQLSAHVPPRWQGVRRFRSWVQTWHRLANLAVVGIPHIKWRKMGRYVSSGPVFLSKKKMRIASRCYLKANLQEKKPPYWGLAPWLSG